VRRSAIRNLPPRADPLIEEIRRRAKQSLASAKRSYVELVSLGQKLPKGSTLDDFCQWLRDEGLVATRRSEIRTILERPKVAAKFVETDLGVREALKLARLPLDESGPTNQKSKQTNGGDELAQNGAYMAVCALVEEMCEQGQYQIDCGLYRLIYQRPENSPTGG
jgi:hypothetical protein